MLKLNHFKNMLASVQSEKLKQLYDAYCEEFGDDEESKYFINNRFEYKNTNQKKIPNFIIESQNNTKKIIENSTKKWINIAAPTSYGKSHMIIEIILSKKKSIVISPTIALCNEYFLKISKEIKKMNLQKQVSMTFVGDKADIYILTPEKAISLFKTSKVFFDFAVLDEFYDAYSSWQRFPKFKESLKEILIHSEKIVTISPSKVRFPFDGYDDTPMNIEIEKTATTREITSLIYFNKKEKTSVFKTFEKFTDYKNSGYLVDEIDGRVKTGDIIESFCDRDSRILVLSSKKGMVEEALQIKGLSIKENKPIVSYLKKYLEENSPNIELLQMIDNGVAYHNGGMDKFVRILIETAFKNGEINILFANGTLTKGVNLNPDYLIVESFSKPQDVSSDMHKIEWKNAIGRTGRIGASTIGKVILKASSIETVEKNIEKIIEKTPIILSEPIAEKPEKISDIESAYKNWLSNDVNINLSKEDIELIIQYIDKRNNENIDKLFDMITRIFNISWSGNGAKYWKFVAKLNLQNMGYKLLFANKMSELKNSKVVTDAFSGVQIHKSEVDYKNFIEKNSLKNVKKYNHERDPFVKDWILMDVVNQYDTVIGFQFKQLLSAVIDKAREMKQIDSEVYEKFLKSHEEDGVIATQNGWPDSFAKHFIYKQKNEAVRDELNSLLSHLID